jgi:hypothetical protein
MIASDDIMRRRDLRNIRQSRYYVAYISLSIESPREPQGIGCIFAEAGHKVFENLCPAVVWDEFNTQFVCRMGHK